MILFPPTEPPLHTRRPGFCKHSVRLGMYGFALTILLSARASLAQRPLGTDVSHYQGTINWTTVKNAGIKFAWAKATESTGYTDPYFTANENNAKAVGIPIGGYHFARPSA